MEIFWAGGCFPTFQPFMGYYTIISKKNNAGIAGCEKVLWTFSVKSTMTIHLLKYI